MIPNICKEPYSSGFNIEKIENIELLMNQFKVFFSPLYINRIYKKIEIETKLTDRTDQNFIKKAVEKILADISASKHRISECAECILSKNSEKLSNDHQFLSKLAKEIANGDSNIKVVPAETGAGGCFFVKNNGDDILAVLKPNSRDVATLFNKHAMCRSAAPKDCHCRPVNNYETTQKEVLSSSISASVPPTILVKLPVDIFTRFDPQIQFGNNTDFNRLFSPEHKVELCSLQKFEKNTDTLFNLTKENIHSENRMTILKSKISVKSFEDAFLTTFFLLGDTDGHLENFIVNVQKKQIFKIDNGFTFPNDLGCDLNSLTVLPHAQDQISANFIKAMNALSEVNLQKKMALFGMDEQTIEVALRRLSILKQLVHQFPNETYRDLDLRYRMQLRNRLPYSSTLEDVKIVKKRHRQKIMKYELKFGDKGYDLRTLNRGIFHALRGKTRIEALAAQYDPQFEPDLKELIRFYESYKLLRRQLKAAKDVEVDKINKLLGDLIKDVEDSIPHVQILVKNWLNSDLGLNLKSEIVRHDLNVFENLSPISGYCDEIDGGNFKLNRL